MSHSRFVFVLAAAFATTFAVTAARKQSQIDSSSDLPSASTLVRGEVDHQSDFGSAVEAVDNTRSDESPTTEEAVFDGANQAAGEPTTPTANDAALFQEDVREQIPGPATVDSNSVEDFSNEGPRAGDQLALDVDVSPHIGRETEVENLSEEDAGSAYRHDESVDSEIGNLERGPDLNAEVEDETDSRLTHVLRDAAKDGPVDLIEEESNDDSDLEVAFEDETLSPDHDDRDERLGSRANEEATRTQLSATVGSDSMPVEVDDDSSEYARSDVTDHGLDFPPVADEENLLPTNSSSSTPQESNMLPTPSEDASGQLGIDVSSDGTNWTLPNSTEPARPPHPFENELIYYGGWVSGGYHSSGNDLFNNRPDEPNLHQGWLLLGKDTATGSALGGRVDVVYGVDGADTQAYGNNSGVWDFQNGFDHGSYAWAIPQAYGQVGGETWDIKAGRFVTILGYESIAANSNFFYSRSIAFFNAEPRTHTGALLRYQLKPNCEVYAGWTLGWDTGFDQFGDGSAWLGGSRCQLTENITWSTATSAGDLGWRGQDGAAQTYLLEVQLLNNLCSVTQFDHARIDSTGADSVGVIQYLFLDAMNAVRLGSRIEWWKGDSVFGYVPHGGVIQPGTGNLSYYAATLGANVSTSDWFVVRPEVRYDWSPAVDYEELYFGVDAILQF